MSKKLRYAILASGFLLFLVLAPAIVMYVRGMAFNFERGQFVQTGILALRAEPQDAQVFLDGKLASKTVKDLKFLAPKEYNISIRKDGFALWEKRLGVLGGQVTWASPVSGKIILLKSLPSAQTAASGITDAYFAENRNTLTLISGNSLILTAPDNLNNSKTFVLPSAARQIVPSPDGQKFILQTGSAGAFYVNSAANKVTDLSKLFAGDAGWYFAPNGNLYALFDGDFYSIAPETGSKALLQPGTAAVAFLNNDFYFLKQEPDGSASLQVATAPGSEGQDILKNLGPFRQAEIAINPRKQIFLMADGTLHQVSTTGLQPIASGIGNWNFDADRSNLIFFHDGELDYINPFNNHNDFITRRNVPLTNLRLRLDLGYAFFSENNTIKALELDTRSHQNEYELYRGTDVKKFFIDDAGKTMAILDGDAVKLVKIR